MILDDKTAARLGEVRDKLNAVCDALHSKLTTFTEELHAAGGCTRAELDLPDGDAEGWSISWTKFNKNWRVGAIDPNGVECELSNAPRHVRFVADRHLNGLAHAVLTEMERLVREHREP